MREKLQTLPLVQLRELAKAQGLKGVTTLKKAEIIDRLCEIAQAQETAKAAKAEPAGRQEEAPQEASGHGREAGSRERA